LRLALAYRDRLSQAIIDRNTGSTVKNVAKATNAPDVVAARTALALLNEGWDWQHRKPSDIRSQIDRLNTIYQFQIDRLNTMYQTSLKRYLDTIDALTSRINNLEKTR